MSLLFGSTCGGGGGCHCSGGAPGNVRSHGIIERFHTGIHSTLRGSSTSITLAAPLQAKSHLRDSITRLMTMAEL